MPNLNPRTDGKEYPVWIIHGPSGSGKTRAAATASEYHEIRPKEQRKDMITLKDMVWLSFDKDGLQSLQSQGMEPHYYDFSYMVPELVAKWLPAVYSRLEEVRGRIEELGCKYIVVDTLSSVCDYFDTYYLGHADVRDPRLAYNASLLTFRQLLLKLRALPCQQIWLSHSRSAWVDDKKATDQQRAARAATLPGEYDVDMALTNGWKQVIRGASNLTMGLDVQDDGSRILLTSERNGPTRWYVKNRYDDLLSPRETVNLRSIFARIANFEAQMKVTQ